MLRRGAFARLSLLGLTLVVLAIVFSSLSEGSTPKKLPVPEPPLPLPKGIDIPVYKPGPMPLHRGEQLVYRASWIGIPAAEARITVHGDDKDPCMWTGEVWIRTNEVVDLLFKMRDYLREDFSPTSLAPRGVYIVQHENRRSYEYQINFDRSAGVVRMVRHNRKGSDAHRFKADNPWGPLSGAIMALSQPIEVGRKLTFDVFVGRNRYVIAFEVAGGERLHTALGDLDAMRVVTSLVYLSDEDARKKARETTVWISADGRHLPLRIEAAAFIGKLRADLVQDRW
jgi:hypothetical protein